MKAVRKADTHARHFKKESKGGLNLSVSCAPPISASLLKKLSLPLLLSLLPLVGTAQENKSLNTVENNPQTNERSCSQLFQVKITMQPALSSVGSFTNFSFAKYMVVPSPSGGIKRITTDSFASARTHPSNDHFYGMTMNNATQSILALDGTGRLLLIDSESLELRQVLAEQNSQVIQARMNTGGSRIVTFENYQNPRLNSWIKDGKGGYKRSARSSWPIVQPTALAVSSDGYFVALSDKNGLAIANADSGTLIHQLPKSARASFLLFNSSGTALFVGTHDGTITKYSVKDGVIKEIKSVTLHKEAINQLTLSSDGSRLVISSADYSVSVVSTENLVKLMQLELGSQVQTATLSPDNKIVTAVTLNGQIHQWDMESHRLLTGE